MSYKEKLDALYAKLASEGCEYFESRRGRIWSWVFFKWAIKKQRMYLGWAVSLVLLQVVEVTILSFQHSAFFSNSSFNFLRWTSSLTLMGILATLHFRFHDMPKLGSAPVAHRDVLAARGVSLAQCLFFTAQMISLAMIVYLTFWSRVHLSTPPLMRAVLLSAVLSFPFDILITFLFYNRRIINPTSDLPDLRVRMFVLQILGLPFLYFGMPVVFLIVKILPRLWLGFYLWAKMSNRSPYELLQKRISLSHDHWLYVKKFVTNFAPTFSLFLLLELSLYMTFRPASAQEDQASMLIYFAHKLIHLVVTMALKFSFDYLLDLRNFRLMLDRYRLRNVIRRVLTATLFYSLVSLLFIPIMVLKREIFVWSSPIGELFLPPASLIALLIPVVFLRSCSAVLLGLLSSRVISFYYLAQSFIVFGVLLVLPTYASQYLVGRFGSVEILGWAIGLDIAFNLFFSVHCIRSLIYLPPKTRRTNSELRMEPDLERFLGKVWRWKAQGALILLELEKGTSALTYEIQSPKSILHLLRDDDILVRLGPRRAWLFIPLAKDVDERRQQITRDFGHALKDLHIAVQKEPLSKGSDFESLLSEVFKNNLDLSTNIYISLLGREVAPRANEESSKWVEKVLQNISVSNSLVVAHRDASWRFKASKDYDFISHAEGFINSLYSAESSLSVLSTTRGFRGFVHINAKDGPKFLLYVPQEHRGHVDLLRHTLFQKNFGLLYQRVVSPELQILRFTDSSTANHLPPGHRSDEAAL